MVGAVSCVFPAVQDINLLVESLWESRCFQERRELASSGSGKLSGGKRQW